MRTPYAQCDLDKFGGLHRQPGDVGTTGVRRCSRCRYGNQTSTSRIAVTGDHHRCQLSGTRARAPQVTANTATPMTANTSASGVRSFSRRPSLEYPPPTRPTGSSPGRSAPGQAGQLRGRGRPAVGLTGCRRPRGIRTPPRTCPTPGMPDDAAVIGTPIRLYFAAAGGRVGERITAVAGEHVDEGGGRKRQNMSTGVALARLFAPAASSQASPTACRITMSAGGRCRRTDSPGPQTPTSQTPIH